MMRPEWPQRTSERKESTVARPVPLHGQVEEDVLDYLAYRARALADGRITDGEASRIIVLADRLAHRAGLLAETNAAVCAAMAGQNGIRSNRFVERIRLANRAEVTAFPALPGGKNAA